MSVIADNADGAYSANELETRALHAQAITVKTAPAPLKTWHDRLAHLNRNDILTMESKGLVDGLIITSHEYPCVCETCALAKATRDPFPKIATKKDYKPMEALHCDLQDYGVIAYDGARHNYLIKDDATRMAFAIQLRTNIDVTWKRSVVAFIK